MEAKKKEKSPHVIIYGDIAAFFFKKVKKQLVVNRNKAGGMIEVVIIGR